jgi:hypothetical protein
MTVLSADQGELSLDADHGAKRQAVGRESPILGPLLLVSAFDLVYDGFLGVSAS